jgi:hypothetical protein
MNKTAKSTARPLAALVAKPLNDAFKKQGFASREIVTRWPQIAGAEIAQFAEPVRMQWPRQADDESAPGTLVLRVDGPAAIEVQHHSGLIIERVNRFFGWQAIDRVVLRQAPLSRKNVRKPRPKLDPAAAKAVAEGLTGIADEPLRTALGRLGAAVKRP